MLLSRLNKLAIHTIVINILLISAPVWGNDSVEFNDLWIPQLYKEEANSIIKQNTSKNIEADLISKGLAIIIPSHEIERYNLYKLESIARKKQLGLWSNKQYKIKTPHTIAGYENSFQIVDGIAINSSLHKDKLYLNFGDDWKTDFTVIITDNALKELKKKNIQPNDWIGETLRIRGWVETYNGPMIKVTNLSQISPLIIY